VRRLLLATAITAVLATASALASSGRAGFRAEAGSAFSIRAYAEQTIWRALGLELATGIDVRVPGWTVTPYTVIMYGEGPWWVALEVAREFGGSSAFKVALMGGVSW